MTDEVVVRRGIVPVLIVMFGVTAPLYRMLLVAPAAVVPIDQCVAMIVLPLMQIGKSIFASGRTVAPVTKKLTLSRGTATRAYPEYATSLTVWFAAAAVGSAVCSAM